MLNHPPCVYKDMEGIHWEWTQELVTAAPDEEQLLPRVKVWYEQYIKEYHPSLRKEKRMDVPAPDKNYLLRNSRDSWADIAGDLATRFFPSCTTMEELTAQGFPCRRDLCQGADARLRAMTPDPAAGLRDLDKRVIEDKWSPTEEVLKRYIA